jgi:hypothetical protein
VGTVFACPAEGESSVMTAHGGSPFPAQPSRGSTNSWVEGMLGPSELGGGHVEPMSGVTEALETAPCFSVRT